MSKHLFLMGIMVVVGCLPPERNEPAAVSVKPVSRAKGEDNVDVDSSKLVNHPKSEASRTPLTTEGVDTTFDTFGVVQLQFGEEELPDGWPSSSSLYLDAQQGHWALILPGELFGDWKDHRFEIPSTKHSLEAVVWEFDGRLGEAGRIALWITISDDLSNRIPLEVRYGFSKGEDQRAIWSGMPKCVKPVLQALGRKNVYLGMICHRFDMRRLSDSSIGNIISAPINPNTVQLRYRR